MGVAAPEAKPSGPVKRDRSGRVLTSEAAKELGRRGGKARAANMSKEGQVRRRLRLHGLVPHVEADTFVRPLLDENERWLQAVMEGMARDVGGGHLSAGVCAILTYAAQDRVMSSFYFELASSKNFAWTITKDRDGKTASLDPRTELAAKARELGISSRGHLQSAHELAAKEALSRKSAPASTSNGLAERVEVLIAAEQANAERWRKELTEKNASVEAPSATAHRGAVADPPTSSPEQLRSGPVRSDSTVAPGAPTAASQTSPAPPSPSVVTSPLTSPLASVQAPSTPRYVSPEEGFERDLRQRCQTWIANSGRRTIDEAQACVDAQRAAMAAIRSRYHRGQEAERNWRAKQSRGQMPVPSVRIPWPASKWFRQDRDGAEADYSVRVFHWILEDEPKEQKR